MPGSRSFDVCLSAASRSWHRRRARGRRPDANIDDGHGIRGLDPAWAAEDALKQIQANIAAGYAVTYVCGYILVLLFVPLVAPRLMGVNLKEEAAKLEEAVGRRSSKPGNLLYRKFQARAYHVSTAAGRTVCEVETQIGRRAVMERILRNGEDVEVRSDTKLQAGDEILLAGPTAAIVAAAPMVARRSKASTSCGRCQVRCSKCS